MALTPGSRIGSYEIVALLGAGGMGEVYRARDSKLGREVAIKVLPESVAADPAALARFEREAKAVAALSHTNILSIFDFGMHDGVPYAVMELLEGETLRGKLDAGPIPQKQAVDYAFQISKGLSAAHEKGVVHRDLKPENLFVQKDGHLKILDFGLAKREAPAAPGEEASATTVTSYTEPGTVMGTVGYMSPEQVRGLPVDPRSDIFSFGAILYELLSGKRAFKRETAADTMSAIMKEEPAELSESGRSVSPALDRIVKHCLEKERDRRFQTVRDVALMLAELSSSAGSLPVPIPRPRNRLWLTAGAATLVLLAALAFVLFRQHAAPSSGATSGKPKRLAVLPFENMGDSQNSYFAAGIAEELINRLSNLQGLKVTSRTTVMGYDRKGKTIRQIGTDLGVDFVLAGTILWEGGIAREGRMRITPELIQVADDSHLWSDHYDRVTADIFAIQSEVAENVVQSMGMKLVPREKTALAAKPTNNVEAYDFYLRGLELAGRSQAAKDQEGAIRMFQAAVDRDPRFALALAELAKAHLSLYFYFDRFLVPPDKTHFESARKVLDSLTAIGADLPETHIARGYYAYWGLERLDPALVDFRAALALQPSSIPALSGASFVLKRLGRWYEAGDLIPRFFELDPRNPEVLYQCGQTFKLLRWYADGDRFYALSASFNRQYGSAWGQRALLQTLWGDTRKAEQLISEARTVEGLIDDLNWLDYAIFRVLLLKRDFPEALRQADRLKRDAIGNQFYFLPTELLRGELYALSGQSDQTRSWFQAARRRLEELTAKAPKDSRYHSALAIAYAGLGLRAEALREARAGVEMMPIASDDWRAMWRLQDLARVHAMLGDQNEAIEGLEFLLSRPSELSTQLLRLDPRWDPLRSNPRFQALLVKYDDKR
jgi:non-specific serine/threonine protein kinase